MLFVFSIFSCGNPNQKKEIGNIPSHTAELERITTDKVLSNFTARVDSIAPLITDWGFRSKKELFFKNDSVFAQHWWLMKCKKGVRKNAEYPTQKDMESIEKIQQAIFKKTWEIVIEKWSFQNKQACTRWLELAKNAHYSEGGYTLEKPPNVFWVENNNLYFIAMTSYADWLEHSDDLVESFSGMSVQIIKDSMIKTKVN